MAYLFKFYHNIGTFPKSNKKITNTDAILLNRTLIYMTVHLSGYRHSNKKWRG
jgi:hypothetical protein